MFNLTVKTDQEAFDAVVAHFEKGLGRCANSEGDCVYFTPTNNCAVGAIVDDPMGLQYALDESCEGSNVSNVVGNGWLEIGEVDEDLLSRLQLAHDRRASWDGRSFTDWDAMETIARDFCLEFVNPIDFD